MSKDYRKNRRTGDSVQQREARGPGKGSVQRPRQISDAEWAERWDAWFGKKKPKRRRR